jgi:hypothetical protein
MAAGAAAAGAIGLLSAMPAHAACDLTTGTGCTSSSADSTVTATIGSGFRTITAAPTTLATTNGVTAGAVAVTVAEAAAPGSSAWGVTANMTTALTNGTTTLPNSALSIADAATPVAVSTGCLAVVSPCTVVGGGATARALDVAQTLFSVTGESTASVYTGTYVYAGTLKLAVPNGTPTGVYTGHLTVTLLQ